MSEITDAAREVFQHELSNYITKTFNDDGSEKPKLPAGHFVQQLLDAEREKWEKKYNQSIEDICCQNAEAVEKDKQERDQLRQQLTESERNLAEAQQWIDSEPDWKDKYMANYQLLQKQLTEAQEQIIVLKDAIERSDFIAAERLSNMLQHQAAIAVKDEALKLRILGTPPYVYLQQQFPATCGHIPLREFFQQQSQALSPNCGQPLMELVREMREALNEASQFDEVYGKPTEGSNGRHIAYRLMIQRTEAALTKAAQLGF